MPLISKKIAIIIFYSFFILFLSVKNIEASVVFSDNFDDGIDDGWQKIHYQGADTSGLWKINSNKQYGMKLNTTFTVGQSVTSQSWTDIEYKLDMISVNGMDKNFVFRFNYANDQINRDTWYEIHSNASGIHLYKQGMSTVDDPNLPHHFPISNNKILQNNKVYTWIVRLVSNNIKVYLKESTDSNYNLIFDVTDNNNPFMNGKIGLRIGTGSAVPTEVYFDNITITDLSPQPTPTPTPQPTATPTPTPTPLPYLDVKHFSQNDALWESEEYDSASEWNPDGDQTINSWGCAMTSAAMILDYHGFDKSPDGEDTSPSTLNAYLKANDGYNKDGGVNWAVVPIYAKKAIENGHVDESKGSLEYSRIWSYDLDSIKDNIDDDQPLVLKIITKHKNPPAQLYDQTHFVTIKGISEDKNTVYINDPEDQGTTLAAAYPQKTYADLRQFKKSNTDYSYLWINIYNEDAEILVEHNQQKSGYQNGVSHNEIAGAQLYTEGVYTDQNLEASESGQFRNYQVFALPKPNIGQYTITISPNNMQSELDLSLMNPDGEHVKFDKTISQKTTYLLTYDPSASQPVVLEEVQEEIATVNDLIQAINYTKNQNWINLKSFTSLSISARLIKKSYPKYPMISRVQLRAFQFQLINHQKKGWINTQAYEHLFPITQRLLQQL